MAPKNWTTVKILGVSVRVPATGEGTTADRQAVLRSLLATVCIDSGLTIREALRHDNRPALVELRRRFAVEARRRGFSFPEIGRALLRHHATIISLVKNKP